MRVFSSPDFFRSPVFFEARRSRFAGVLRVRTQLCEPLRWCGPAFDHVDHSSLITHHQRLLLLFICIIDREAKKKVTETLK